MTARSRTPGTNLAPKQRQDLAPDDPFSEMLAVAEKENVELRRALHATRKQVRALQEDIAAVHAGAQGQMDGITMSFTDTFAVLEQTNAEMIMKNDALETQLLASSHSVDAAAGRVEAARVDREAAKADHSALAAIVEDRRRAIADATAELAEMKQHERELQSEIRSLEDAKRSGFSNLEAVRAKNEQESEELASEEAKLAAANAKLDILRGKIADLRRLRNRQN